MKLSQLDVSSYNFYRKHTLFKASLYEAKLHVTTYFILRKVNG